jgi:hypothetical protein
MKQTAVEWLKKELEDYGSNSHLSLDWNTFDELCKQAKAMEREQIIDAYYYDPNCDEIKDDGEQYYNETYGGHCVDANEMIDHNGDANKMVELPQQELSHESWEGCDGCTEQDEIMYKNGYVKGYNAAISELPKEISDKVLFEQAILAMEDMYGSGCDAEIDAYFRGAKWMQKQLKGGQDE